MAGLFSTIGSLFGPVGGALGAVGDGVFGAIEGRKQAKRQNELEMNKFVRLREAAERGGYHPLEVLRAGGNVSAQAAPRLMSTLAMSNSFDALEDEISGEGAKARRRQEVDDEIQERQLQNMKYEIAQRTRTRPTILNNNPAGIGPANNTPPEAEGNMGDEGLPATVSDISAKPREDDNRLMANPNKPDFGLLTERWGESELIESLAFPFNMATEYAYNLRLSSIAEVTGKSRAQVHAEIAQGGPQRARELYAEVLKEGDQPNPNGRSPMDAEFWTPQWMLDRQKEQRERPQIMNSIRW